MSSALLWDDADDGEEELRVNINKRYAKDYQSRKQREELRNADLEDSDDSSSSTNESEDEDGDLLSPSLDVSILKTIRALRSKDASIYDPSNRFFPDADEQDEERNTWKEKKHVPKRLKDVIREQIVEQMETEETKDDATEEGAVVHKANNDHLLEYDQEQKALRAAFLESTQENDDEDDWMVLKKREKRHEHEHDELIEQELKALEKATTSSLIDPRGEVEDGDKFLLDFIKNKKWIDKDEQVSLDEGDQEDDSMDELEKADNFESKYNFRFEEAEAASGKSGADFSVVGYARSGGTMNTLRRKDETRKHKREERKERKAAERKAKEEQLRRLKNAKREEMEAKLTQIKSVLGHVEEKSGRTIDEATMMKLVEGDYDPEKFEQLMNEVYGDDFYQQQDAEWKTDRDVRETLLKDEDGEMIVGQDDAEGGLYDYEEGDDEYGEDTEGADEDWNDADDYGEDAGDAYFEETETEKKLREKMMDELYKLDYEDIIAGMPTRFKYRKVEPNNYGLTTEEILFARDSTLKNYVSLKKMAPYREGGDHHVGAKKRRRFREMLKQDLEETLQEQALEQEARQVEQGVQGDDEGHKKKKKRRRQKGKKEGKQQDDKGATKEEQSGVELNANQKEKEPKESTLHDDSKAKRKRKKKGKKFGKLEETQAGSGTATEENGKVTDGDKASGHDTNSIKKKKSRNIDKKRRKLKTVAVEGVSASRLESYNL